MISTTTRGREGYRDPKGIEMIIATPEGWYIMIPDSLIEIIRDFWTT